MTQRPWNRVETQLADRLVEGRGYLIAPVVALITDPHEGAGSHVGVTDDTLPVTFLTQPA